MAVTSGCGGAVKWNGVTIANIDTWSLAAKGAVVKTTAFGATGCWEVNTPTLKDWTASCAGRLDPADTLGQWVLLNGLGTAFTVLLQVDGSHHWSGPAIVTGLDPKTTVSTTVDISISFDGNGTLTFA